MGLALNRTANGRITKTTATSTPKKAVVNTSAGNKSVGVAGDKKAPQAGTSAGAGKGTEKGSGKGTGKGLGDTIGKGTGPPTRTGVAMRNPIRKADPMIKTEAPSSVATTFSGTKGAKATKTATPIATAKATKFKTMDSKKKLERSSRLNIGPDVDEEAEESYEQSEEDEDEVRVETEDSDIEMDPDAEDTDEEEDMEDAPETDGDEEVGDFDPEADDPDVAWGSDDANNDGGEIDGNEQASDVDSHASGIGPDRSVAATEDSDDLIDAEDAPELGPEDRVDPVMKCEAFVEHQQKLGLMIDPADRNNWHQGELALFEELDQRGKRPLLPFAYRSTLMTCPLAVFGEENLQTFINYTSENWESAGVAGKQSPLSHF